MKRSPADVEQFKKNALVYLRKRLRVGSTVYTVRTKQTRRGGAEHAVLIVTGGKIKNVSSVVTDLLDWHWADNDAVAHSSAFDIVQQMSYALHGYESAGRGRKLGPVPVVPTPKHFKAGYSLVHQIL